MITNPWGNAINRLIMNFKKVIHMSVATQKKSDHYKLIWVDKCSNETCEPFERIKIAIK